MRLGCGQATNRQLTKHLKFRMHQGIAVSVGTEDGKTYRASSVLNSIAKVRKSQYAYASLSDAGAIA